MNFVCLSLSHASRSGSYVIICGSAIVAPPVCLKCRWVVKVSVFVVNLTGKMHFVCQFVVVRIVPPPVCQKCSACSMCVGTFLKRARNFCLDIFLGRYKLSARFTLLKGKTYFSNEAAKIALSRLSSSDDGAKWKKHLCSRNNNIDPLNSLSNLLPTLPSRNSSSRTYAARFVNSPHGWPSFPMNTR